MQRAITNLLVYDNQFLVVFESGDSEMFWIYEEQRKKVGFQMYKASFAAEITDQKIFRVNGDKDKEHEVGVTFACFDQTSGCFLTGDKNGIVKLWSKSKRLLTEFSFFEHPTAAVFKSGDLEILLGHKQLVSEVPLAPLIKQGL